MGGSHTDGSLQTCSEVVSDSPPPPHFYSNISHLVLSKDIHVPCASGGQMGCSRLRRVHTKNPRPTLIRTMMLWLLVMTMSGPNARGKTWPG